MPKRKFIPPLVVTLLVICFWIGLYFNVQSIQPNEMRNEESKAEVSSLHPRLCYVNMHDNRSHLVQEDLKVIYYVTPTYPRPEQLPELTRLSHTLMHVPRLHWIVADDQSQCSAQVLSILKRSGLPFTHLVSPKPHTYKGPSVPRGVANRRAALAWLRENAHAGVLYFGDDDNTVDLRLFDEIRNTEKVSMFPVGLIGQYGVSSPIVKDGQVVGFFDSWPAKRAFPVDMAGFAVDLALLRPPDAGDMPYIAGHEEDRFLQSLGLRLADIQPLADDCSKVLVWHTRTLKYKKPTVRANIKELYHTKYRSFGALLNETSSMGMASFDPVNGVKTFISRNKKLYNLLDSLN